VVIVTNVVSSFKHQSIEITFLFNWFLPRFISLTIKVIIYDDRTCILSIDKELGKCLLVGKVEHAYGPPLSIALKELIWILNALLNYAC